MPRIWPALVGLVAFAADAAASPLEAKPFSSTPTELATLFRSSKHDKNDNIVIALESAHYRFDKRGNYVYRLHRIYKILNARGAQSWDYVIATYAPWYQSKPQLRARVITAGGAVVELDPASIAAVTARGGSPHTYSDQRQIKAPLPAIAAGAIVEEETVIRTTRPFFDAGDMMWHTMERSAPARRLRLTLDAPSSLPIKVDSGGRVKLARAVRRAGGRTVRSFVASDVPARAESEWYLPYGQPRTSFVAFSTGRSWKHLASSYARIVDARIAAGPVPDLVARLPRFTGKNRDAVVAAALALVSDNVRYTGLELGQAAIVPWSPSETWSRKYGDCKDKATLLVALLRGAGLDASVALINSGFGADIRPRLPGLGGFDHVIVAVASGPRLWIDPTSELARPGELPRSDQGRWALPAGPRTTRPVKTPIAPSSANRIVETREIALAERGPARVVETTRYSGSVEQRFRYDFRDTKPADMRERMTNYAKHQYGSDKLGALTHGPPADLSRPFELRLEVAGADNMYTSADKAQVFVWPSIVADELPDYLTKKDESAARRTRPMQIAPLQRVAIYKIAIPEGFRPITVPEPIAWRIGQLQLATRYTTSAREITATVELDTGTGRFSAAEVEELRRKLPPLRDTGYEIALEHIGAAEVAAGRWAAGLAEIRRLIKLHPKEALHHLQLADALLEAGLAVPARKAAERALRLEPRSTDALGALAWIVQHDDLGRPYQRGWQRGRALALYKRAVALAPDEAWLRGNYGILLSRGAGGEELGGDLEAAASQYRQVRERTDDKSYDVNLLRALLHDSKYQELEQTAAAMEASLWVATYRIVAAALAGGEAAIKRKLSSLGSRAGDRDEILAKAALVLMQLRRYKLAAAAMGARAARIPAVARQTLARTRAIDRNPHPATKPESAVVALILAYHDGRLGKPARALLTRRGVDLEELEQSQLVVVLRTLFRVMANTGLPELSARDSLFATLDLDTKSLAGGAVVDVGVKGGGREVTMDVLYLINSRGRFRVVGTGLRPGGVGGHILSLLDRGDVAGARAWLEVVKTKSPGTTALYEALGDKPDKAGLELAAAAIAAADRQLAPAALARLRKCPDKLRFQCDRAMSVAQLFALRRPREALRITERMLATNPKAVEARRIAAVSQLLLGNLDRAGELADALLAADPDDQGALHTRAMVDVRRGEFKKAKARLATLKDAAGISSSWLNDIAWLGLFSSETGAAELELVDRALAVEKDNDASILNTKAALHAARGELKEARETLLLSIENRGTPGLEPGDWLVHGRIAAALGYTGEARRAYRKVKKPDTPDPGYSSYFLARRWLKALR